MAAPIVEVKNLRKVYAAGWWGRKVAVESLSFSLLPGTTTGFLGANGAGKSTTILAILDLIRIDGGEVRLFGRPAWDPEARRKCGFCAENFSTYRTLTPVAALKFLAQLSGLSSAQAQARAEKSLTLVELEQAAYQRIQSFSKGMLQRLGIAQSLIHEPEFLVLDEPTSGLDPDGRRLISDLIKQHKQKGGTVLFSSHILSDVEKLTDRVLIMKQGRLVYDGATPHNLDDEYARLAGKGLPQ